MKKLAIVLILIIGLFLAGCGSGSSNNEEQTTTGTLDKARVDKLIDLAIDALQRFDSLQGKSEPDQVAEFKLATADFNSIARQLRTDRPSGIPDSVARDVADDSDSFATAVQAESDCLQQSDPSVSDPCAGVDSTANDRAKKVGEALSELVPYGTRTKQEVLSLINLPTSATQQSPPVQNATQQQSSPPEQPNARNVTGTATTLGAGSFSGGKDVADGLYDVTAAGGYGNFMVSGQDYSNDILGTNEFGSGVSKVRVHISDGDSIQMSGLKQVTFTPVTAPLATSSPTVTNLYAGTFVVGPDIAAGRYVATASAGGSGNFIVEGTDSYNGILGGDYGTPNITVTLTDGDTITISGLDQVTMTPTR